MGCHALYFDLFLFKVCLVNKHIKETMNRQKNNTQGTNGKKKNQPFTENSKNRSAFDTSNNIETFNHPNQRYFYAWFYVVIFL